MSILSFLFGKSIGRRSRVSAQTLKRIQQEWANIDIQIKGGQPSQLKQALISADKTLDNALRDLVPGETMGERLKEAKNLYDPTLYDKLWKAHKMRNSLVHESGYEPPHHMIIKGISDLKAGVKKLGVQL